MKKILLALMISLLFSCGTGIKISAKDFDPIEGSFSKTFKNNAFKTSKSILLLENGPALLGLFGVLDTDAEVVTLNFKDDTVLELVYDDKMTTKKLIFEVKHISKGYIEIVSAQKKVQIPPILPIFYSRINTNRIRIGFTNRGELVVDNEWQNSGSVFIFSGGAGGRTQYFFEPSAQ